AGTKMAIHCSQRIDQIGRCDEPGSRQMAQQLRRMRIRADVAAIPQRGSVSPTALITDALLVADGRDYEEPQEWRDEPPRYAPEEQLRYPPPRRYPPAAPYPSGPPPVAPGFIELPGARIAPCGLMTVGPPPCI